MEVVPWVDPDAILRVKNGSDPEAMNEEGSETQSEEQENNEKLWEDEDEDLEMEG